MIKETEFDIDSRYLPTHYLNCIRTLDKKTYNELFNERRLCYTIYNVHDSNWIALEIDFVRKQVNFYDPFQTDKSEYLRIKFLKIFDVFFDYTFVDGLKQSDGYNYGVYWVVCKIKNRKIDLDFDPDYYMMNFQRINKD